MSMKMRTEMIFFVLLCCAIFSSCSMSLQQADGRMRMCPPGGSTFTMAWGMSCSMRRRKRDIFQLKKRALVAPSVRQMQNICCDLGCNIEDLLPFCSPI